jgi:hypothetical protein
MPKTNEPKPPKPNAPESEWTAYRADWSDLAMQDTRRHLQTLHEELVAKIDPESSARALQAFRDVLAAAGVEPWAAARAQFALEGWDDAGFPAGTEFDERAAEAWREAISAGQAELCDKAPWVSRDAVELVDFLGRDPKETAAFGPLFPLVPHSARGPG